MRTNNIRKIRLGEHEYFVQYLPSEPSIRLKLDASPFPSTVVLNWGRMAFLKAIDNGQIKVLEENN